jgi:hypothetical protein
VRRRRGNEKETKREKRQVRVLSCVTLSRSEKKTALRINRAVWTPARVAHGHERFVALKFALMMKTNKERKEKPRLTHQSGSVDSGACGTRDGASRGGGANQ